jgi:hypothetical protein
VDLGTELERRTRILDAALERWSDGDFVPSEIMSATVSASVRPARPPAHGRMR